MEEKGGGPELTGSGIESFLAGSLVATGEFADGLVAGADEDDEEERQHEGEGAGDLPAAEDDAEVFGGPGEEHLERERVSYVVKLPCTGSGEDDNSHSCYTGGDPCRRGSCRGCVLSGRGGS
jgi:hypothetical protein